MSTRFVFAARRFGLPAAVLVSVAACGLIIGDDPTVIVGAPDAGTDAHGASFPDASGEADAAADARGDVSVPADAGAGLPDATPTGTAPTVQAIEIGAWEHHACAVRVDGRLSCWGNDQTSVLGSGAADWLPAPTLVTISDGGPLGDVHQVALGMDHACARIGDAGIACWGSDQYGAAGIYPGTVSQPPGNTIPGAYTAVAAKGWPYSDTQYPYSDPWGDFSCAIDASGRVACWGSNSHDAIGETNGNDAGGADCEPLNGPFWCNANPTTIAGISNAKRIALDDGGGCAALGDGTVACWGWNASEEVDDTQADAPSALPIQRADGTPLSGITDLAAGHNTICAIQGAGGGMYCWGRGVEYEFGVPDFNPLTSRPVAFAPGTLPGINSVAIGQRHVCVAAGLSRAVWCTGWNGDYEVGNGTDQGSASGNGGCESCVAAPAQVLRADNSQLEDVVELAAGWSSTCARTTDGAVYCWGSNYLGATGHPPGTMGDVPCQNDYCTPRATLVTGI